MKILNVLMLLLTAALAGCYSPAPPPAVTAENLAMTDIAIDAVETAKSNTDRTNATWARKYREDKTQNAENVLTARIEKLTAAETRPSAAAILEEVKFRDKLLKDNDAEIAATLKKLHDDNLDVALEALRGFKATFTEMSERDKLAAFYKSLFKLKTPPPVEEPAGGAVK